MVCQEAKEPKPDEEKKEEEEEPEYIDPAKAFPEVEIEVKLATPPVDFLNFKETLRTNTRIQTIKQMIIDKYDGAIRSEDISMCLNIHSYLLTLILKVQELQIKINFIINKCKNIIICLEQYSKHKEHWLDPQKRLCDVGVTAAATTYKIIYDFVPISYPLLNTPLANIVDKNKVKF